MPRQATPLHIAIATATATDAGVDGDLDCLVDELGTVWFELPQRWS